MIRGEIKILKAVIEAVVHKITVDSIVIDGLYSTVNTCNTLYLNTGKILTIDAVKYRVTEFVLNEYFILKAVKGTSTINPALTEITIPNPRFYDGTPRRVQIENLNDKEQPNYQSPIIWLLTWVEILPPEDKNTSYIRSTIQGANIFFLDDCNPKDWNQEDHRVEVWEPMENEMWHIFRTLEARTDIFDKDIQEPRRRFHSNFGTYLTNKGYENTILTGAWSGVQATLDIPYITDPCDCDEIIVCAPARLLLDGVTAETIDAGSDLNVIIENQDGDTPDYSYDTDTDVLTVQTGGGGDVTMTFNTDPVTSTPAGDSKAITVRNSDLDPIGTASTDTANVLVVDVANATQTMNAVAITPQLPETEKTFEIRYANNDPVVVTTITDTATVFLGEIPDLPVVYDPSAQALFDIVGDVPEIVKPFFSDLIASFKTSGVWYNANFWAIMCVPSLNAFNTLIEIKSLAIQSSFFDTGAISIPYNNARQAIPTFAGYSFRSNGYIKTGFIPSSKMTLNNSSEFLLTYSDEIAGNTFNYGSLSTATATTTFSVKSVTNALTGDAYSTTAGTGRVSVAATDGVKGVYIKNRRSATYMSIVKNGTVVGNIAGAAGTLPLVETHLNAYNNNGTVSAARRNQSPISAWGSFGSGLTASQETDLSTALTAWQESMERVSGSETKQIILDGNSHTVYWLAKVMRTIEYNTIVSGWKYTNVGVSGQTLTQMIADFAAEVAPLYNGALTKNIFLLYEGTNEMHVNGTTVDATVALVADYVNLVHALGATAKIIVKKTFCRPRPTSGAGLVTYPTETIWNLAVDEYNSKITTLLTGADAISDCSVDHFILRSSYGSDALYNTAVAALITNATNFYDTTHLTELGYQEEADIDTIVINSL